MDSLHADMIPEVYKVSDGDAVEKEELKSILEKENKILLGAFEGEQMIAYAHLEIRDRSESKNFKKRRSIYINSVGVDTQYQGRGVGKAIMTAVESEARSHGCEYIDLDVWEKNSNATSFYEFLGYSVKMRKMSKKLEG